MNDQLGDIDHKKTQALLAELLKTREFPSLSQTIMQVNQIVNSDESESDELTNVILHDISLTNKLLRVVNTAHYSARAGHPISTVSRAVVVLGFNTVRDVATSLMLFNHLRNHSQAQSLKSEALESYYCGVLGHMIGKRMRLPDAEEAFISAMFRNLGRLMTKFYFYERTVRVARLVDKGLSENDATREILGTTYDQIGQAIAQYWRLPQKLIQSMAPMPAGEISRPDSEIAKLRGAANLAYELYRVAADNPIAPERTKRLNEISRRYAPITNLPSATLRSLLHEAAKEVEHNAGIFEREIDASPMLLRLIKTPDEEPTMETTQTMEAIETIEITAPAELDDNMESMASLSSHFTLPILASVAPETDDPASMLAAGLQEMTEALVGGAAISDILHMVLEIFYRTGAFDRVMIAVRDKDGKSLSGRFGFGKDIDKVIGAFKVNLTYAHDVFQVAAGQGVDILVTDTKDEKITSRIPEWHHQRLKSRGFLLMPLVVDNKTLALLYADKDNGTLDLDSKMLNLLKVLRNQALLVLRQKPLK